MSNSQNLKLLVFGITEGNNNGERPHRKWVGAELANKNWATLHKVELNEQDKKKYQPPTGAEPEVDDNDDDDE